MKANQYDKAEELITFYTFAPLGLRTDKKDVVERILRLADVREPVVGDICIDFEKLIKPPEDYLSWLAKKVSNHPVKYIREQAEDHKKRNKSLETATHVDVLIETDNLGIFVETKFTSDISTQTVFNPDRNQLARLVDVGTSVAQEKNKKIVVLLCTPSRFFTKKSRLYFYKIKEYSDIQKIQRDIEWRGSDEIQKYVKAVAWIPLEKVINVIYTDFNHPDKEEAVDFFRERNLA